MVAVVIAGAPAGARADSSVVVTLNAAGQQLAADYGQSEQELIDKVRTNIEDIYQTQNIGNLLRAFANTAAFADRGLGADYQADAGTWTLGVAATGALATDLALGNSSHVVAGAVVNIGAMAGTSLARWGAPRWSAFASGSYEATTIHGLAGSLVTGGANAQVKVLDGRGSGRIRWTGVDVTSGLEIARWTVSAAAPIQINFRVTGSQGQKRTIDLASTGTLAVHANTYSVPLEVTTGVRFFRVLALYGGGGLDLTFGGSDIAARLSGDLTIDTDHEPIGTAVITASGKNGPDLLSAHALAGIELHTRHVRVFVQGTLAPSEEALTVGVRVAP